MSRSHRAAARRRRRRIAPGAALLAQTALLLPLTAGPVPPAYAATPATTPGAVDCSLQLLARSDTGSRSELLVALPERLAGVDLLAPAFSLRQANRAVPVTVRRPPATEQAVAVVLASSPGTSTAEYDAAQAAARQLLVSLPSDVKTAVGSTSSTSPLAPLSLDRARATRSVGLTQAGAGATAAATVARLAPDLPAGAHIVLFSDGRQEGRSRSVRALASRLRERGTVVTRVRYAGSSSPEVAGAWSTSPSQQACAAATAGAPLLDQLGRVQALLRSQYRISASVTATAPATLSVRAAGISSSIQLPVVDATPALADPYRRTGPSGSLTLLLLALAAELAVLGTLLSMRPRRRRRVAGPARPGADVRTAPVERSLRGLDRTGLGARHNG